MTNESSSARILRATIGVLLGAALLLAAGACGPVPGEAPCTKTGADSYGTPYCPLTSAQIQALPEAHIVYPGSTDLGTYFDPGALEVNGEPVAAYARGDFNTEATDAAVLEWYAQTLTGSGWIRSSHLPAMYVRQPPASEYCEYFVVRVYAGGIPGSGMTPPPSGGTYYQAYLEIPSTALLGTSGPDSSGKSSRIRLRCGAS